MRCYHVVCCRMILKSKFLSFEICFYIILFYFSTRVSNRIILPKVQNETKMFKRVSLHFDKKAMRSKSQTTLILHRNTNRTRSRDSSFYHKVTCFILSYFTFFHLIKFLIESVFFSLRLYVIKRQERKERYQICERCVKDAFLISTATATEMSCFRSCLLSFFFFLRVVSQRRYLV